MCMSEGQMPTKLRAHFKGVEETVSNMNLVTIWTVSLTSYKEVTGFNEACIEIYRFSFHLLFICKCL